MTRNRCSGVKGQAEDLSECQVTGCSGVEGQAEDLSECQVTGCSGVEGTDCGFIRVPRNRVTRVGRNRLRIYLNQDKKQDVQKWKEKAADLSEYQGTGCSGVERNTR